MSPQNKALLARFLLGTFILEVPILTGVLSQPSPDYKLLAIGLLGGLAAGLEKYLAPQLTDVASNGEIKNVVVDKK